MRQKVTLWLFALPLCAILLVLSTFSSGSAQASTVHPISSNAIKLVAAKRTCPPLVSYGDIDKPYAFNAVYYLQFSLNNYRHTYRNWQVLDTDGNFGPKTLKMVRRFQSLKHLDVDGIVGPKTWHALGWC